MRTPKTAAFTLLELLCVIAIIAALAALILPGFEKMRHRADAMTCLNNLRQIGSGVNGYIAQHDGRFPEVEPDPSHPIYPTSDGVLGLQKTLEPYGITPKTVQCPADMKTFRYFEKTETSYEWRPYIDDELMTNPQIITPRGQFTRPLSKIVVCMDVERVHDPKSDYRSKKNYLYADGHVRAYWETAPRQLPAK
jgi:prepilin-type N-terminal cleavage/methylation domain-containing protein/prepilin-type processing-associated H-X9-DG protein